MKCVTNWGKWKDGMSAVLYARVWSSPFKLPDIKIRNLERTHTLGGAVKEIRYCYCGTFILNSKQHNASGNTPCL